MKKFTIWCGWVRYEVETQIIPDQIQFFGRENFAVISFMIQMN